MNAYVYDEIAVGHTESFTVTVTPAMMDAFRAMTGDVNPLHADRAYAQARGSSDVAVFGMLTASFLSTLAGVYLPGKYSLIHKVEVEFPLKVMPGEDLTISGEVREKDDRFHILHLAVAIRNRAGQKVCRGKMTVGVLPAEVRHA